MGALDDPTTSFLPRFLGLRFFAPWPDVGRVAVGGHDRPHLLVVVARVQAQVLFPTGGAVRLTGRLCRERPTRQGAIHQFHIVPIGAL